MVLLTRRVPIFRPLCAHGGTPCSAADVQRRAGPVVEDVLARIKEVRLTFPRRPQEAFPVWFVENGGDSASASYGLAAGNLVDLQTPNGHGNGEVEGGGGGGVVVWLLRTYYVSSAEKYWRRSVVSCGWVQGFERTTDTRQWASAPGMS